MSYKALSWATNQELPHCEKLVLIMLANRADPESHRCFPSMGTLSHDCGMSLSQTRKAVVNLEKLGLVQRTPQMKAYGQTSNIFTLAVGETPALLEWGGTPIERHKQLPLNSRSITKRFRARRRVNRSL